MNRKQLIVLWIGVACIVAMILYPPWEVAKGGPWRVARGRFKWQVDVPRNRWTWLSAGNAPLWIGPDVGQSPREYPIRLNMRLLGLEAFVVALIAGAGILTLRTRSRE